MTAIQSHYFSFMGPMIGPTLAVQPVKRLLIGLVSAVVTVDTVDDVIDFNDGVTSLREAIFATNTVPGADEIEFGFESELVRLAAVSPRISDP